MSKFRKKIELVNEPYFVLGGVDWQNDYFVKDNKNALTEHIGIGVFHLAGGEEITFETDKIEYFFRRKG